MTRLDSVIRRLMTQRSLLDWASREIAHKPGLVVELGLGNGRTYDHLRNRLPGRDIYVFERSLAAHPGCLPPEGKLIIGDIFDTLPVFTSRFGVGSSILVHADLGSGDQVENDKLVARLSPMITPLLAPGGLMLADRLFDLPGCADVSAEVGVEEGRYFAYRRGTDC